MDKNTKADIPNISAHTDPADSFIEKKRVKKKQDAINKQKQAEREFNRVKAENEDVMIRILQEISFTNPERCKIIAVLNHESQSIGKKIVDLQSEAKKKHNTNDPSKNTDAEIAKLKAQRENLKKTIPELESSRSEIMRLLKSTPFIGVNINEIDEKLIGLVQLFSDCIFNGGIYGAYASKTALYNIISTVRCNIPKISSEELSGYLEKSSEYIDVWVNIAKASANIDRLQTSIDRSTAELQANNSEFASFKQNLKHKTDSDPQFSKSFNDIIENKITLDDDFDWTETMFRAYMISLDYTKLKSKCTIRSGLLTKYKQELESTKKKIPEMQDRLIRLDPNKTENNKQKQAPKKTPDPLADDESELDENGANLEVESKLIGLLETISFTDPSYCKLHITLKRQSDCIDNNIEEIKSLIEQKIDLSKPTEELEAELEKLKMQKEALKDIVPELEKKCSEIAGLLKQSPFIDVDIHDINRMIMNITKKLVIFINRGYILAAYTSGDALLSIIKEVRFNIPDVEDEYLSDYIDNSKRFIETWENFINAAADIDYMQEKADNIEIGLGVINRELIEKKKALRTKIRKDPSFAKAFTEILDENASEHISTWTDTMKQANQNLYDMRMIAVKQKFKYSILESCKQEIIFTKGRFEIIRKNLCKPYLKENPVLAEQAGQGLEIISKELSEAYLRKADVVTSLEFIENSLQRINTNDSSLTVIKDIENKTDNIEKRISYLPKTQTELMSSEQLYEFMNNIDDTTESEPTDNADRIENDNTPKDQTDPDHASQ